MEFSYTTATSEADWGAWVRRNVAIVDGGLSIARTTSIREADLSVSVVDHAVDPTGVLYTVHESGALYRYDPTTDLHQRLLDGTDSSIDRPCAPCASENRVYIADAADGPIVAVSPRLQRELDVLPCDASDPRMLRYVDGVIYALDGDDRLVTVGGEDDLTVDWWLQSPIDIAVDDGRIYALDETGDGMAVRAFSGDEEVHEGAVSDGYRYLPHRRRVVHADGDRRAARLARRRGLVRRPVRRRRVRVGSGPGHLRVPARTRPVVYRAGRPADRRRQAAGLLRTPGRGAGELRPPGGGRVRPPSQARPSRRRGRPPIRRRPRGDRVAPGRAGHRALVGEHAGSAPVLRDGRADDRLVRRRRSRGRGTGTGGDRDAAGERRGIAVGSRDGRSGGARGAQRPVQRRDDPIVVGGRRRDPRRSRRGRVDARRDDRPRGHPAAVGDGPVPVPVRRRRARRHPDGRAADRFGDGLLPPTVLSPVLARTLSGRRPVRGVPRAVPLGVRDFLRRDRIGDRALRPVSRSRRRRAQRVSRLARDLARRRGVPVLARECASRTPRMRADLYKKRGTKAGLRAMLELYLRHATAGSAVDPAGAPTPDPTSAGVTETGHRLFFLEPSDLECIESESARRQFESLLPGPHSFALCCGPFESAEHRAAVERIVETETPAHVTAAVLPIETEFTLGVDTFLGVNSDLRPRSFAMGEAALGEDTVLGPGPTAE